MKSKPGILKIAIPAILTAAAVYISLVYASKLTATFFDREDPDQLVRNDIEVTDEKPFVEQTPPPSPEAVAAMSREEDEADGSSGRQAPIVLEPELEPDPGASEQDRLSIEPIDLGPISNPANSPDAVAEGTSAESE